MLHCDVINENNSNYIFFMTRWKQSLIITEKICYISSWSCLEKRVWVSYSVWLNNVQELLVTTFIYLLIVNRTRTDFKVLLKSVLEDAQLSTKQAFQKRYIRLIMTPHTHTSMAWKPSGILYRLFVQNKYKVQFYSMTWKICEVLQRKKCHFTVCVDQFHTLSCTHLLICQ